MTLIERIRNCATPPAIIAELSGNHEKRFELARQLIETAAASGANAVKLQTYTADSLTLPSDQPDFIIDNPLWKNRSLHELYQEASTPYEWHAPLAERARECGIELFSTPFDEAAVDFLEESIFPPIYKIASFELTHLPLLRKVAQTGKPVILSAGMASEPEIEEALATLDGHGCPEVVLLKCVSAYPASPETFNLRSMNALADRFGRLSGLSDHTLGSETAIAATALGARAIEKHFVIDRKAGGVDAAFSIEPNELRALASATRIAHAALGANTIGPTEQDVSQLKYRRSIYVAQPIAQGATFTEQNLRIVRPASGLAPKRWDSVLGKSARRDLTPGTPLRESDVVGL